MKAKSYFVAVFTLLNYCSSVLGQSVNCSNFSVIGINPDAQNPNGYNVSIQFNATSNSFINYPHVSALLDCNGNTVATGVFNVFGQVGQTTINYPVTASGALACSPLTTVFVFGDNNLNNDTCLLIFGATTGISAAFLKTGKLSLFPNPTMNQVNIQTHPGQIGTSYLVYDYRGNLMLTGRLISEHTSLDLSNFASGMYFIKISDNLGETFKIIKE